MFDRDATKLKGYILVDGKEVAETKVCCHCGKHWVPEPGSGKVRGFCVKCHGFTCGQQKCCSCIPLEARLEFSEAKNDKEVNRLLSKYPELVLFPW